MNPFRSRQFLFLLVLATVVFLYWAPLTLLVRSSSKNELYSHILLIPFVSVYLAYRIRERIIADSGPCCPQGVILILVCAALFIIGTRRSMDLTENDYLSLMTFGVVLGVWGGFLSAFGRSSFRSAALPMLFLLFSVPVPDFLMQRIISLLQQGSAEVSSLIFKLTGTPVYRDGFLFQLPGLSVEVAKQCGGIRSSLALFITSILAGHLFLRTGWGKGCLALSVFPITIFKNAVRIVFLSLYGAYVDPRILSSVLHRWGGVPFFFAALGLLAGVLWIIARMERRFYSDHMLLKLGLRKA